MALDFGSSADNYSFKELTLQFTHTTLCFHFKQVSTHRSREQFMLLDWLIVVTNQSKDFPPIMRLVSEITPA